MISKSVAGSKSPEKIAVVTQIESGTDGLRGRNSSGGRGGKLKTNVKATAPKGKMYGQ